MTITLPTILPTIEPGAKVLAALRIDNEETFYEQGQATEVTATHIALDDGNAFNIADVVWHDGNESFDPAAGLTRVAFSDIAVGDHIIAVRQVGNQTTVLDTVVSERDEDWYSQDSKASAVYELPAYTYYRA